MSAATQTRVFGVKLGIQPKFAVGALMMLALLLFWYNSQDDTGNASSPAASTAVLRDAVQPAGTKISRARTKAMRGSRLNPDRGTLRVRPVDPTKGDIDPTVRLDLLAKVQSLNESAGPRNLFEIEAPPAPAVAKITGPVIMPEPLPVVQPVRQPIALSMQVSIPLKYYGFVASPKKDQKDRGLFLDGDNVLVAAQGDFVKGRYRVVELTPLTARMEDTQVKLDQVLPVAAPVTNTGATP